MKEIIYVCCVCKKVIRRVKNSTYKEDVISHGLCDVHFKEAMENIEKIKKHLTDMKA